MMVKLKAAFPGQDSSNKAACEGERAHCVALHFPIARRVLHNHRSQGIRRENGRRLQAVEEGREGLPQLRWSAVDSFHVGIRCD